MLTRKIEADSMLFYDGDTLVLTVEETDLDGGVLLTMKGEIRSDTTHHIQDELEAFISVGLKVTIDFTDAAFIAPSVLNALLNVQQLADFFRKGEIVLRHLPDEIYQKMDANGITELLMIED